MLKVRKFQKSMKEASGQKEIYRKNFKLQKYKEINFEEKCTIDFNFNDEFHNSVIETFS